MIIIVDWSLALFMENMTINLSFSFLLSMA